MTPSRRTSLATASIVAVMALTTACAAPSASPASTTDEDATATATDGLWDESVVHSIQISYEQDAYAALIDAYVENGEKEWIAASIVIDGVTFDDVGLKLKGNSSLRGLSTDADADLSSTHPEELPWIIDLDKFVDGQNYEGAVELVVRGNTSETALNEAVALDLLAASGLAAEQAISARVEVDGAEALRLVVENPDDSWMQRELEGSAALYKAEAGGDYSYRGDDVDEYTDVFDQQAGEDDLDPLIDFLQFINESDDATFEAELADHLDVDAFATYLAFQELVGNFDDIDGPGNNSYLAYDSETGRMTVVSWDLNLALGGSPGGGRGQGGGDRPQSTEGDGDRPARGDASDGAAGGMGGGRGGNILSERFLENDSFSALYDAELDRLTAVLYTSGLAEKTLDARTQTLIDGASDLVSDDVIDEDAEAVAAAFTD